MKYVKRNFLPVRGFLDQQDFAEQLAEWLGEVADVHIHSTTHERPIDRFAFVREHLMVTAGEPEFRLKALASRWQGDELRRLPGLRAHRSRGEQRCP